MFLTPSGLQLPAQVRIPLPFSRCKGTGLKGGQPTSKAEGNSLGHAVALCCSHQATSKVSPQVMAMSSAFQVSGYPHYCREEATSSDLASWPTAPQILLNFKGGNRKQEAQSLQSPVMLSGAFSRTPPTPSSLTRGALGRAQTRVPASKLRHI